MTEIAVYDPNLEKDKAEVLQGLAGAVQTLELYPGQPIEHVAFEQIHFEDRSASGSVIGSFVNSLAGQRAKVQAMPENVARKEIFRKMELYARRLSAEYPESTAEHDRRLIMWKSVLDPNIDTGLEIH